MWGGATEKWVLSADWMEYRRERSWGGRVPEGAEMLESGIVRNGNGGGGGDGIWPGWRVGGESGRRFSFCELGGVSWLDSSPCFMGMPPSLVDDRRGSGRGIVGIGKSLWAILDTVQRLTRTRLRIKDTWSNLGKMRSSSAGHCELCQYLVCNWTLRNCCPTSPYCHRWQPLLEFYHLHRFNINLCQTYGSGGYGNMCSE